MDLAYTAQSYTVRLQVALALRAIGRKKEAEAVLQELVKTREAGLRAVQGARREPETGARARRFESRATSFGLALRWRLLRTACWVSGVQKMHRRSRALVTAV
jgi:hypothetical protein